MKIDELSIQEKIGQMIIIGMDSNYITDRIKTMITKYKIGGIILYRKNFNTYEKMLELIKYVVNQFAENPNEVEYLVEDKGNSVDVTVVLKERD